jgi:DNA-directed RNA polymerase subunit RPC12/RpoP
MSYYHCTKCGKKYRWIDAPKKNICCDKKLRKISKNVYKHIEAVKK